ncbi:ABC transporter membrane protein [Salmonella enterica subsp. enterica]|nr:ABC transporter membrane protein [Salmonella enterica subsp. enterica]
MDTIHYMLDNAGYLASLTFQHLWLVALAVGLAIIIGVPLGVLIVRHKWLAMPVLGARHATSYHSVYRAVWINDPALFADRAWYWRSARCDGRFSLLFTADCP